MDVADNCWYWRISDCLFYYANFGVTKGGEIMKIDWKQKLSSRKFWAAITSLVVAVFAIFGVDQLTTEQVIALVAAVGALTAYILSEGYVDANRTENKEEKDEK